MPAVPSEVSVVAAGTVSAAGSLDLVWVIVAAGIGAEIGDMALFLLSRRALTSVLERSRFGRRLLHTVGRAHRRLDWMSAGATIVGRFIPLGRTATTIAAGVAGVATARFLPLSVIGGVAWAAWQWGLGYVTGRTTSAPLLLHVALGVGVGLVVGVWVA